MSTETESTPAIDPELRSLSIRLRRSLLTAIYGAKAGHTGGSLSCVDILNVLYHRVLRIDPRRPDDPDRDRYVQSKGHAVEALYAVLAARGFFPESDLGTLCRYRSPYVGHPTRKIPGIEQNTGALGHGLSVASGMALGARLNGADWRTFALLGDGELAEGSNWEAALFAAHHGLDRLTAIIDHNGLQITGPTTEVMATAPLADKWRAFGWTAVETDGHDLEGLTALLREPPRAPGRPTVIIAHTVKGKGISFMENVGKWHHGVPAEEQFAAALAELDAAADALETEVAR